MPPMPALRPHAGRVGAKRGKRLPFDEIDRQLAKNLLGDDDLVLRLLRDADIKVQTLRRVARGEIKTAPWRDVLRKHLGRPTDSEELAEDELELVTEYRRALRSAPHRAPDLLRRARAFADACESWRKKSHEGEAMIDRALDGDIPPRTD